MMRFITTCYSCPQLIHTYTITHKLQGIAPHIQYTICDKCYKKSLGEHDVNSPKVLTEDDGKMFEMGICLALGIPYNGKYKYGMDIPNALKTRLEPLKARFPDYTHSAKSGARYDYTSIGEPDKHISAKTTKKGNGKIAPQVIGQAQPQKFCDVIGIPYSGVAELKKYIQENIATILPVLFSHTFDCPMLYYNVEKNSIRLLQPTNSGSPIDWSAFSYTWTCDFYTWNNSSCVKITVDEKTVSLMEFQFHTKSRTNMAVRWCFEELLSVFGEHFTIENL
jgi:hypothetical protein